MNVRGIDTDNYDGDVSVARFESLRDNHGVRFNIVGGQVGATGNFTDRQVANSHTAGLVVPCIYDFLYYAGELDGPGLRRMAHAAEFGLPVAPDIEGATHRNGVPGMLSLMHKARDFLVREGLFWGWYSSPSEWARLTGGTRDFAGDRGWSASYPYSTIDQAILPPADYLPLGREAPAFGGCRMVCWQYANICYDEPSFDMNAGDLADLVDAKEEPMIRLNRRSAWFDDPAHQTIAATAGVNARLDFKDLPAEAVAVELEVFLQAGSGSCQVLDGDEDAPERHEAFFVSAGALYGHGRVELDQRDGHAGWLHLEAAGAPVQLSSIGIVGWYRA